MNQIGLSVIGQSEGIAVADKKMYALRDVTATAVSYTHLTVSCNACAGVSPRVSR